jgi:hypothetical protein
MIASRRFALALTLAAISLAAVLWWGLHPVCVPLSDSEAAAVEGPIGSRTDRDLLGPIFQYRDGQWHQCKSWISRQFFF